ncbi:hypothetical protein BGX28_003444, partial [Mortierella sp. GBA30]
TSSFKPLHKQTEYFNMRFTAIAALLVIVAATVAEAGRQCQNGSANCNACVCNKAEDTKSCCVGYYNSDNGNCEGIKSANSPKFQKCCNGKSGFGRCW